MPMRITSLHSGLDTESIIAELVKAKSVKKNNMVKAQTKLSYKQDAWKALNTKVANLYSKTMSNLKYASSYSQKKTSVSNSSVASVITGDSAGNGVQNLRVDKLAKSGYLTGAVLGKGTSYSKSTKLSDIAGSGLADGDSIAFDVKVGSQTKTINVNGYSSIGDVVSQLKNAGVNANFDEDNQRLFVYSKGTGKDLDFSITANTENGSKALSALGINYVDANSQAQYKELADLNAQQIQDMIEAETQARADAVQSQIDLIDKAIADYEKKNTEFLADNGYQDDTAVDNAYADLTAEKAALSVVPGTETADDKKIREEKLKEVENKMKGIENYRTDVANMNLAKNDKIDAEAKLANNNQAIRDVVTTETNDKIDYAKKVVDGSVTVGGSKATRITGQDAVIYLNDAEFTSNSNVFKINGLTITALTEGEEATLTTTDDYDAVYDTLKGFIKEYNELIIEMDKLYNAESSKGYEPLTDEEKEAMSDSEVEKWENKIKDSVLRRDSTLSEVANIMKRAMSSGYTVNGKTMYLSDFGISTGGYFTSSDNEKNAYHINGDKDDPTVSGNDDVLKGMIANDPSTVISFFTQLTRGMSESLGERMKSSDYSSFNSVYDDKKMKEDYADYKTKIAEQEKRILKLENKYYKQFTAMETALARMQSSQSAITSLLGGS